MGFFNIHSVAKLQKIEGGVLGKFFSREKSLAMPIKLKRRTLLSRSVLGVTKETFLVQFFGPTCTIWHLLKIKKKLVELFWSLQVKRKKNEKKNTDEKH